MTVWLNGERRDVDASATLAHILAEHGVPPRGVAVAVDGTVVPRDGWHAELLAEGARIEVLTAVQGG